jgi:CheY-like chemotaxis protein
MLVLAVDDDEDDLGLFTDALKHLDPTIDLITANNGEEALDFLRMGTIVLPDLIFLDINMPRMDGQECLREIKSDKYLRRIPIIMHSTSLSSYDKQEFARLDAKFITKSSTFQSQLKSLGEVFTMFKLATSD